MKRVALYSRVSTEEQSRNGLSIDTQKESLRKYAVDHDYQIVGEYCDSGISGHISYRKRPSLMRMLSDISEDKIDLVLFTKLDRFTRKVSAYYEIMKVFDEHHVSWCATLEDYETETSSGRFKVNIMLSVAQDEAERTAERIKFVLDAKAERGEFVVGMHPFGYDIVDKHAVPNADAEIVRHVFDYYMETRSTTKTAEEFNRITGKEYTTATIHHMLSNKRYIGDRNFPPIIDTHMFQVIQGTFCHPTRHKNEHDYLFKGLVFSDFGAMMSACTNHRSEAHEKIFYYAKRCDKSQYAREMDIEKFLLANVEEEFKNLKVSEVNVPEERKKLSDRLARLQAIYLDGTIDKDTYSSEYHVIQQKLSELADSEVADVDICSALSLYDELTYENRCRLWHKIIRRIDCRRDGTFCIHFT